MFRAEWRTRYNKARQEYNSEAYVSVTVQTDSTQPPTTEIVTNWAHQQAFYKPNCELWWCGCPSYKSSAYHLCKHLIRLYVGDESFQTNEIPRPPFGDVFRQNKRPLLFIRGLHPDNQLSVHQYLSPDEHENTAAQINSEFHEVAQPMSTITTGGEDNIHDASSEDDRQAPYDSSDEESEWGGAGFGESDEGFGEWENGDDLESSKVDDGSDRFPLTEEEMQDWAERELAGDQVKEEAQLLAHGYRLAAAHLEELALYPSTHQHLSECPKFTWENSTAVWQWAKRREDTRNSLTVPRTWGANRRGNMFM